MKIFTSIIKEDREGTCKTACRASRQESTQNKKESSQSSEHCSAQKKVVEKRKERSLEADNEVLKENDSVNHPS